MDVDVDLDVDVDVDAGEVLVPCPEGMRREIHGSAQ